MQKVQIVDLKFIEDRQFLKEQYEMLGFIAKIVGDDLELYWGRPTRPKKVEDKSKDDKPAHKPGQEKTARRLGR